MTKMVTQISPERTLELEFTTRTVKTLTSAHVLPGDEILTVRGNVDSEFVAWAKGAGYEPIVHEDAISGSYVQITNPRDDVWEWLTGISPSVELGTSGGFGEHDNTYNRLDKSRDDIFPIILACLGGAV